jgi:hypothetical protein
MDGDDRGGGDAESPDDASSIALGRDAGSSQLTPPPASGEDAAGIAVRVRGVSFHATGLFAVAGLVGAAWFGLLIVGSHATPAILTAQGLLAAIFGVLLGFALQNPRINDLKVELERRNDEIRRMAARHERLEKLVLQDRRSSHEPPPPASTKKNNPSRRR